MRLYGITGEDIEKTLNKPDRLEQQGDKMVALKKFGRRFKGYPLKVVYSMLDGNAFIITAYPLKRKEWR